MKRAQLNFLIDAAALVTFVLLASTGVLMHYVLPPGSGRFSLLWEMDRHAWGQLHFWIAVALMACMILHLLLHWRWIASMVKGRQHEGSGFRVSLAVFGVITLIALAAVPFLGRVEQTGEPPHGVRSTEPGESQDYHFDGSMTLREVEQLTAIPRAVILRELGLPGNPPLDERLGRLCKEHGIKLHDVREVVRKQRDKRGQPNKALP